MLDAVGRDLLQKNIVGATYDVDVDCLAQVIRQMNRDFGRWFGTSADFDLPRVEWERAAWTYAGNSAAEVRAKRDVLRWHLHALLAQAYEKLERYEDAQATWEKAFELNAGATDAIRASCVEFVLAGLYASDRISRATRHGRMTYET